MKISNYQTGIGLRCGNDKTITFGQMSGFYSLLNSEFSFVFNVNFLGNNENYFFGGAGAGSRVFYLIRNLSDSKNGSLTFKSVDASGDERTVTWISNIPLNTWNNVVINSLGSGNNNLKLYINGVEQTISSQLNDAGFLPETNFDLKFGEANTGVVDDFIVSGPFVLFNRSLTDSEISNVDSGIYPTDHLIRFNASFPNIGLNEAL